MNSENHFDLPAEITCFYNEYMAFQKLRDIYVKIPFGFKKAKKCAIQAENVREKFWRKIHELYPELKGKIIKYNLESFTVSEIRKSDES